LCKVSETFEISETYCKSNDYILQKSLISTGDHYNSQNQ
jgi:hypothetical protein